MRFKQRVLKKFPDAKTVVTSRYADGSACHVSVYYAGSPLDIHDDGRAQMHAAAWRSAYFWTVRNSENPNA